MTIGYFLPLRSSKLPEKGSIVLQTVISTTADRFVSPSTKSTRKARASQPMILNFDGKLLIARDTCVHRLSPRVGAALACQETSWNGFAALHTAQRFSSTVFVALSHTSRVVLLAVRPA